MSIQVRCIIYRQREEIEKMQHKTNGSSHAGKETAMIYDNLDEWLNDENKIITYRWLSLTLGLHVNRAKQVLESFVSQERSGGCKLSITYCLGGLVTIGDVQVYKVVIVNEEQRQSIESTLLPPISCHIYSIQKSPLKSSDVLFMTDFDLIKSSGYDANKHSAVHCDHANLRTQKSKTESTVSSSLPPPTVKSSASSSSPALNSTSLPKKTTQDANKPVVAESASKQVVDKSVNKSNSGFSKLFGSAAAKPKMDSSASKTPKDEELKLSEANSSKSAKSQPETSSTVAKSKKLANSPAKNNKSSVKKASPKKETKSKKENKKKEADSDKGTMKRRRIVVESSSSEDEEVVISPSPSPEPVRSPAELQEDMQSEPMDVSEVAAPVNNSNSASQPNVQRKLVSKTYVNDEGFMVTEKVWETGATDDNLKSSVEPTAATPASTSNDKPASVSKPATMSTSTLSAASNAAPLKKKAPEKKPPAKAASGKQASLMNFFQKK